MTGRLRDKAALIAGGASGVGLATARRFLEEGARVAITGADAGRLKAAQRELGGEVLPLRADGGLVESLEIARTLAAAFGQLDALFVDAGGGERRALEEWDEAGFDHAVAVTLKAPFFLIQALLPVFANPASVVLRATAAGRPGAPRCGVSAAARAGLTSLAGGLSGELIGRGIRINAIISAPFGSPPEQSRGDPTAIAEAAVFLASDAGASAVGGEFVIDGGISRL